MSREEAILSGNHLDKVICQVTFNPVLSIDNDAYGEGAHAYEDILGLLDGYNRECYEMLERMLKKTAIERMSR